MSLNQYTLLQVKRSARQHNLTSEEGLSQVQSTMKASTLPDAASHTEHSSAGTFWLAGLQRSFCTRQVVPYAVRTSPLGLCTPAKPSLQRSPSISCQNLGRVATAVVASSLKAPFNGFRADTLPGCLTPLHAICLVNSPLQSPGATCLELAPLDHSELAESSSKRV